MSASQPAVSVLMPTWNRARFLRRAIDSLLGQTLSDWELILIDDGSTEDTRDVVAPYLADSRISYRRLEENVGLGAALNEGLSLARASRIAYLPSDDVYYPEHLASLVAALDADPQASLAFSGVRHSYNRYAEGQIEGRPLQLVQAMHRRTEDRWTPRSELVTDDLGRMFWDKLLRNGSAVNTGQVTCEWVSHPGQLHKLVQEPIGGINLYRTVFQVRHPLRFHTTTGNAIDEVAQYARFRERPDTPPAADGLKILLVGELAYNADRVLALEERGHQLFGLWMPDPYWYNTVGPVPFGHVTDLDRANWRQEIRRVRPDVIYALLNWQAVPFCREVLADNPGVPLVWHFKEGPFICLEKGTWDALIDLYTRCQGRVYCSPEMRDWFATFLPDDGTPELVLDGDLPKADWFSDECSPRLSDADGEIHTVVPGRPIGLHPETVQELARHKVHLHFYGDFIHGQWRAWIDRTRSLAEGYIHTHPNVGHEGWVREFSRYDAGWLHFFASRNRGEIRRADWDDLNVPARISTLAAAGLPTLQRDNSGSIVATQTIVREHGLGLFFRDMAELAAQLAEERATCRIRENVWRKRSLFTFDHHADRLVDFFRSVIGNNSPAAGLL